MTTGLSIVTGHDNRIPFRVDGNGSLADKSVLVRFRPPVGAGSAVDLESGSGVDMGLASERYFAFDLTSAQTADWDSGQSVTVYLSIFNPDNSLFSKGTLSIPVTL